MDTVISRNKNKQRLNLLMIVPYSPYPVYTGGAGRIYQKIKYFGQRHDLSVVCFYGSSRNIPGIYRTLGPFCRDIKLVKRKWPFLGSTRKLPEKVYEKTTLGMWFALLTLKQRFDLVMFEHIYLAQYRGLFRNSFTVIEEHNIESKILGQLNGIERDDISEAGRQARIMKEYETATWPRFDLRTVVSAIDRDEIINRTGSETLLVENGVDTRSIRPVTCTTNSRILFMGHLSYRPNVEAVKYLAEAIMPRLRDVLPDARLCIAGARPCDEINGLNQYDSIEIVADPPDMREVASHCFLTVVPLFIGSGTRIKILESMAMGLPVVSSTLGCEGLMVNNREHLVVCDNPGAFVNAIIEIKTDEQFRDRLANNGRRLVETRYDCSNILSQYESRLLSMVESVY